MLNEWPKILLKIVQLNTCRTAVEHNRVQIKFQSFQVNSNTIPKDE